MPSTAASVRFWATACIAQPSLVRVMKSCSAPMTTAANRMFPISSSETTMVPRRIGSREKTAGNGSASGVQNCCSEYRMSKLSPMVAMTRGSTPILRSLVIKSSLTPTPSRSVETRTVASMASANGSLRITKNSTIANAGSTTNSPCAKLIVFDVCQSSTKPMAAMA